MPIDTIRVNAVFSRPIRNGLIEYTISADTSSFTTLDMWKAAVAQRAKDSGQPLTIGWQDTKFGPRIVTVELVSADPKEAA